MIILKTYIYKSIAVFTFSLLFVVSQYAQTTSFKKLDKSDGLPSNFTYRVLEDLEGNIWICTNKGLCKYNGDKMCCFDQGDGLPDEDIYKITMDDMGRIWLLHAGSNIAFIQNDSIYVIPTPSSANIQEQYFNLGENQGFVIGDDYYIIDGNNTLKKDSVILHPKSGNGLTWNNYFLSNNYYNYEYTIKTIEGEIHKVIPEIEVKVHSISQYHHPTNSFQIYANNKLYILDTLFDIQETIDIELPDNQYVLSSLKDQWGNIWICSKEGLYVKNYLHNSLDIKNYQETDGRNIIKILDYKNSAICIDDRGGIFKLENNLIDKISDVNIYSGITYDAEIIKDQLYISYGLIGLTRIDLMNNYKLDSLDRLIKEFAIASDTIMYSIERKLGEVNLGKLTSKTHYKKFYKNITIDTLNQNIWLNTNDSLHIYNYNKQLVKTKSVYFPLIENLVFINNARVMITTADGKYFVCDSDSCLSIFDNEPSRVKSLKVQNENIWLNQNSALYRTSTNCSAKDTLVKFFDYNTLQDQSILVNDALLFKDRLLLGTVNGLISIGQLDRVLDQRNINLAIEYSDGSQIKNSKVDRSFEDRNFAISCNAKYFGDRSQLFYEYYIQGSESDTILTSDDKISINDLAYGDYQLMVRAKDVLGNKSDIKYVDISISKAWFHRPLVYLAMLILLSGIMYSIFRYYLSRIYKKNMLQQQLAELELSALQSQMNPHFVFNAMNSIQNLIINNKSDEADLYVSKLSGLMRRYLESSKEKYISMEDELEIIEAYLQLEKLRFGNRIKYHIVCDLSKEDLKTKIPATMIQPFVENALKHGLFHKQSNGNIYIKIHGNKNDLFIIVEDDGVGRAKVKDIQRKNRSSHNSTGIQSIKNKLEVLRKLDNISIDLEVEDLMNGNTPSGTRVNIRMRKIKNI